MTLIIIVKEETKNEFYSKLITNFLLIFGIIFVYKVQIDTKSIKRGGILIMKNNKTKSKIYYIVSILCYISAILFVYNNIISLGTLWLCNGTMFFCLGVKFTKQSNENVNNE